MAGIANIFSTETKENEQHNGMIDTQSARESQEVQAMMVIMKRFPEIQEMQWTEF